MVRIATALACLAAACCGAVGLAQSAAGDSKSPPSVAAFALSYERSGGFAPAPRSLRIEPGRRAIVKRRGRSGEPSIVAKRFRIGVEQVRRLQAALERAGFLEIVSPEPGADRCADCFLYSIEYRGHEVLFNDATKPKALGPVVARIEGVIAHHLPFH
jgi:hypothetical protein